MLKCAVKYVIGLALFFSAIQTVANTWPEKEDEPTISEFWQELYIYRGIGSRWTAAMLYNNLYSSKWGNYDWFLEARIIYQAKKWLTVEAMYRHEFYDVNDVKVQEYRPMLRFSGKKKIGIWSFRNRHRIELRMFEIGETRFRYRTDLKIKPNLDWSSFKINPYVQEELFVSNEKLSRNRLYCGLEGKKGRFEPTIYALLQSDNREIKWHNRFIIGIMLGLELN